jgi:hypothetical protein
MLSVAQIALGIALSVLLLRYLTVIIRVGAVLLLALVILFLWLCFWPVIGPVCWIKMTNRGWRRKRWSDMASPAPGDPGRRISNSS